MTKPEDSAPRILLLGGTTHRNRGDLAMQAGLAQWLQREIPGCRLRMLASNPEETRAALGLEVFASPDSHLATTWTRETPKSTDQRRAAIRRGRAFLWKMRLFRLWPALVRDPVVREFSKHLAWSDAVIVPGSGSMNSLWWHDWLYPKAFTVLAAAAAGRPVVMSSQGVGPDFDHPLDAEVAGQMFRACRYVGVRDGAASGEILQKIGVGESQIVTTGDDALLFESKEADIPLPKDKLLLGVNLRDSSGYAKGNPKLDVELFAKTLRHLLDRHPELHLVFVPISYDAHDDDRKSAERTAGLVDLPQRVTIITAEYDADQLRRVIARLDACVGVSYHFLMFALWSGVPALGIAQNPYYQQKIGGLFRWMDFSECAISLRDEAEAAVGLPELFQQMIADRRILADRLRARISALDGEISFARKAILRTFTSL